MRRPLKLLALGICANALVAAPAAAQTAPEVTLTLLADCGTPVAPTEVNLRFSDTYAYGDLKVQFVFSCYLIRNGNQYLLWDTGHSMTAPGGVAPKTSVVAQLAQLGLKPEQIQHVGISHYHADHTGQVASFPNSTLLIGQGDWDAITQPKPAAGVNAGPFAHWISGAGKMEALPADKDVFGDGSVMILNTPGHTPGHHSLLVKLRERGNFLITGDLVHFHENYNSNGVPWFNVSRADTLASIDRFKQIAMIHKAKVIIQHDARDIGILPAWPAGAK